MLSPHRCEGGGTWPPGGREVGEGQPPGEGTAGTKAMSRGEVVQESWRGQTPEGSRLLALPSKAMWCRVTFERGTRVGWGPSRRFRGRRGRTQRGW